MKKILKIAGFSFLGLIVLLVVLPILFKGQITEAVRTELNKQLDATVEFDDVGISLIRNFPNLNFRLYGLSIEGKGDFEGTTLLSADYIGFTFNLASLWRRNTPYELRRLDIDGPKIHLITFADGRANYDILPNGDLDEAPDLEEEGDSPGVDFSLRAYRITNGHLIYDDRMNTTYAELKEFNHSGSGNFAEDIFDWSSSTQIGATSVNYGGVGYLRSVPLNWDLELGVDLQQNVLHILQNDLSLSELKLDLSGLVRFPENDNLYLDLVLNAPGNEFRELFSVLPIATLADLDELEAAGEFGLNAEVKGEFDEENELYPPFVFTAMIQEGMVRYPAMELPLEAINLDLNVQSPEPDLDAMTVDLSTFSFSASNNPFSGSLFVSTPISDPTIRSNLNGILDLGVISQIFPVEGMEELAGRISAALDANFAMSQVDAEAWDDMDFSGEFSFNNIVSRMEGMPAIEVPEGGLSLNKNSSRIAKTVLKIGSSDLELEGDFNSPLVLYSGENAFAGNMRVKSQLLDIDDLMAGFITENSGTTPTVTDTSAKISPFFNVDIDLNADMGRIVFSPYDIRNLKGELNLKPQLLTASSVALLLNDSDIEGEVSIQNWYEFAMADERMTVDANVRAGTLDLVKLMPPADSDGESDEKEDEVEESQAQVPPFKYNIHVNARADRVLYDPYELTNLTGRAYLTERDIHIESFQSAIYGDVLSGSGFIGNYMNYVYLGETLTGEMDIRTRGLNLNKWMEGMMSEEQNVPPEEVNTDEFEPILVPDNIDFGIRADLGSLAYFDMNFRNAKGAMEIKGGAVEIESFTGDLLNGRLGFSGVYDTSDETPSTSMELNLERLDIPSSFTNIATLASIAPIFEYMNGLFSSSLVMATDLGPGMMPVWSSFNAEGMVKTIDAYIVNFPPLKSAAERLQFDLFDRLDLNNTENWFEIVNGTLDLKPVTHKVRDTELEFSGQHLIGGDMDYVINASIPQDVLGTGTVGAAVTQGLDFIRSQAGERGVDLGDGSHVDVAITLKGRLRNPDVGVRVLGVSAGDGDRSPARDRLDEERERARERVEEEVDEVREQVREKAAAIEDSLRRVAEETEEEIRKRARQEAEDRIKGILGGDRTESDTTAEKKDTTEDIRDRIRRINPFGRGQNNGG